MEEENNGTTHQIGGDGGGIDWANDVHEVEL